MNMEKADFSARMANHRVGRLVYLLKLLGIAALYALLAKIVLTFFSANGVVSIVWPPSGLALSVLLMGGKRYFPGVFLGAFLANAMTGLALGVAAAIAIGNTLEALLGAWLLTRDGRFDSNLRTLRDYMRLVVLAGFVACSVAALNGSTTLLVSGFITTGDYFQNLLNWWMGDALGIMLVTPLILAWRRMPNGWLEPKRMTEAVLVLGLTLLVGQIVFLSWFHSSVGQVALGYWMFLFVTWAAVRLGIHGVVTILSMTAIQGLLGAIQGVGFFAHDIAKTGLVNYWFYIMALSVVGMALSTHFTERKQIEATLSESEERYRALFEQGADPIWLVDAQTGSFVDFNTAAHESLGYTREEFARLSIADMEATESPQEIALHIEKVKAEGFDVFETTHRTKRGELRHILVSVKKVILGGITHLQTVQRDITERKHAEEQIRTLAFYDALTQLPNRRLLNDRLGQTMAASKRSGHYGALMFLDMDNFKPLNDAYGHGVGDLLLIEVAHRLTGCVREVDTIARFGGDEFVVMLSDLDEDKAESTAQAGVVAEKIRAALAELYLLTFRHEGEAETTIGHHCTSSIGVVLFINHEASQEDLLKWADMAMYQAKNSGRNRICIYE